MTTYQGERFEATTSPTVVIARPANSGLIGSSDFVSAAGFGEPEAVSAARAVGADSVQWSRGLDNRDATAGAGVVKSSLSPTGPLVAAGSVGGQYVNGSASLGSLTSTGALWSAGIDGVTVNTQLNNALSFAQPFQVVSLGSFNFNNLSISNSITNNASIRFSLRISAGGEASFTSAFSFQAVPGPASLALIGFLPIVRSRRRR